MTKHRNMHRKAATDRAKRARRERLEYADSPGTSRRAGASKINKIVKKWRGRRAQASSGTRSKPKGFLI